MEYAFNRRKLLKDAVIGGMGLLIGCGSKERPTPPPDFTSGELYFQVEDNIHTGKYTSVSKAGPYLIGTRFGYVPPGTELYLRFRHGDDEYSALKGRPFKPFLISDNVPEELLPQEKERDWVLPLINLACHGNGPFTIYEIGMRDKTTRQTVGRVEEVEIPIEVPHYFRGWEQSPGHQRRVPVRLPNNSAESRYTESVQELNRHSDMLILYKEDKPVHIQNHSKLLKFTPECLTPIWLYNQGIDRNTNMIKRFHLTNTHAKVFGTNPHAFTRRVIVDEIYGGGKAWHDAYRVGINGIHPGTPCCSKPVQPQPCQCDEDSYALLDTHEQTHVIDLNQGPANTSTPYIAPFKAECWNKNNLLDIDTNSIRPPEMIPERTIDDFVTSYSMRDDLEDLADTVGHALAFGERVREYIIGKDRVARKVEYAKQGFLKGKDWTCQEVEQLAR